MEAHFDCIKFTVDALDTVITNPLENYVCVFLSKRPKDFLRFCEVAGTYLGLLRK
jgi:hypothetical protein